MNEQERLKALLQASLSFFVADTEAALEWVDHFTDEEYTEDLLRSDIQYLSKAIEQGLIEVT